MILQNDIFKSYVHLLHGIWNLENTKAHAEKDSNISKNKLHSSWRKAACKSEKSTKGCELCVQNYDESKQSLYLTVECFLLYCALHMHVFAYVCVCVCVWGNIINTLTGKMIWTFSKLNQVLNIYHVWSYFDPIICSHVSFCWRRESTLLSMSILYVPDSIKDVILCKT